MAVLGLAVLPTFMYQTSLGMSSWEREAAPNTCQPQKAWHQLSTAFPAPFLSSWPTHFNPVAIRNPIGNMYREESIWLKEKEANCPLSHRRQQAWLRPDLGKGRRCDIKWNSHDLIFTSNWLYQLVTSSPLMLGNNQKVLRFALHLIQGNNWPHITILKDRVHTLYTSWDCLCSA